MEIGGECVIIFMMIIFDDDGDDDVIAAIGVHSVCIYHGTKWLMFLQCLVSLISSCLFYI